MEANMDIAMSFADAQSQWFNIQPCLAFGR